ncbi:hypothetical protein P280DRAFT_240759 [Massarina eburnea CBS 473.64]|uniref:Myb-like domain-containing protein n=1 Tax=Massarina eburnea CBS 473.64 TaxID=1395130 RepID=A0A6A6S5N9_9PLEO|nr:hypothetical protein P280DRAFT_240759 [Massarina eburnea CBS 473.64]
MEPRIATLLGSSSSERAPNDLRTLLPPPSVAPRRPHPASPNTLGGDAHRRANQSDVGDITRPEHGPYISQSRQNKRKEPSVPIAGVLNDEAPTPSIGHAVPAVSTTALPPFSGRLSDLLLDPLQRLRDPLDPSQDNSKKRRKLDEQTIIPPLAGSDNKLKLPKPTQQLPKKTPKRPRIPPLLQGLHHPPPLPEKVFPPITGEAGGFGRDIGDRVGVRSPVPLRNVHERDARDDISRKETSEPQEKEKEKEKEKEGGKEEEGEQIASKPGAASTSDKDNSSQAVKEVTTPKVDKSKETRKRNKWSEQETKDLLVGVSRFGIGNWKKILQCSDFTFNQRTAVDLKDRFRVCCPGDGLKKRKVKCKSDVEESGSQDRKGPVELAKMGIHVPFTRHKRRERCEFTEKDDENLLRGFEKYASSWHSMRDDSELGFTGRHPTDLRDRFRIRYPEKFAKAGYKLKAKDELMLKAKDIEPTLGKGSGKEKEPASQENVARSGGSSEARGPPKAKASSCILSTPTQPRTTAATEPTFRSHALQEDAEDGRSPIILSRNILQWVDANPSQAMSSSSTNAPTVSAFNTDTSFHMTNSADGLHIDPLATYNIAMPMLTSTVLSATPSYPSTAGQQPSVLGTGPHNPYSYTATISPATMSMPQTNTSSTALITTSSIKSSSNPLLRTPNLPNLMYPPVPVSSAKNTIHNLPPPADLLYGLDTDVRATSDSQSAANPGSAGAGFAIDENTLMAFHSGAAHIGANIGGGMGGSGGFDSSATLAPMVGATSQGQGVVYLDRDLLDERFLDRRGGFEGVEVRNF